MADDKKGDNKSLAATLPITAVLALLAGFIANHLIPYQEERPSINSVPSYYRDVQDVDARLWQDPFAAIASVDNESANPSTTRYPHTPEQIYFHEQPTEHNNVTIIAVTLPGAPYQEAAENRMRRRYAVLSGLANQNYTPDDEQHIGYFYPDGNTQLQKKVAFEWWINKENVNAIGEKLKILVLWVDELGLSNCPAAKLQELLRQASSKSQAHDTFRYTVIGPNTSTLLLDMVLEDPNNAAACVGLPATAQAVADLGHINQQEITYYAASATAYDQRFLKYTHTTDAHLGTFLKNKKNITLYRTTANDYEMMQVLVRELKLRHITPLDQIVILSEWDTFYGQSIRRMFQREWETRGHPLKNIFSYMRGLDGKLPNKPDKPAAGEEKKADSKDKPGSAIEFPEGQNQKDYLRRLAETIDKLDRELKAKGNNGVNAIGILGSDVHDILMILEALRPYFPHKQFFTTDLNAAYNHPSKLAQTHNLLVASAYDLTLRPELQGVVPAFRDSYQTAFFATTQILLTPGLVEKIGTPKPLLFEVGSKHFIPLPTIYNIKQPPKTDTKSLLLTAEKTAQPQKTDTDPDCKWSNLDGCKQTLHPLIAPTLQIPYGWGVSASLFLAIVLPLVCWRARTSFRQHWQLWLGLGISLIIVDDLVYVLWNPYNAQFDSEPFYWLEGVSAWPSLLLLALEMLFACLFFIWGNKRMRLLQTALQQPDSADPQGRSTFALPSEPATIPCDQVFYLGSWTDNREQKWVDPAQLWQQCLGYGGCFIKDRQHLTAFARVFVLSFVVLIAAYCLINWGDSPGLPMRGTLNLYPVFFGVIFVTLLLTIWVVENARLFGRLISLLSTNPSRWHETAKHWAADEKKVAPECVNDWLDIKLVETVTEAIQPLIWGPIGCIVLLALARSPAIDDWNMPWGLCIALLLLLLYTITAEVYLQLGANSARNKAITLLSYKISEQRNVDHPNEVVIRRIEAEIERIRALRKGAFRPWYELPLFQSFGGLGTLMVTWQYVIGLWESGTL